MKDSGCKRKLKHQLFVTFLILLCIIGLDCRNDTQTGQAEESSLRVLLAGNDENFMSMLRDDSWRTIMFLPLVRQVKGEIQPLLAERWEHTSDYRDWTIYLRKDVTWHDGTPFTAHDIAASVKLWKEINFYQFIPWASVEVVDDYTLKLHHSEPSTAHLNSWTVFYPKHKIEGNDPAKVSDWDFWKEPIGNGPFRYVRHVTKMMMEFEANPDFILGKPKIEKLIIRFAGNAMTEFLAGNVDIIFHSANEALALATDPRFQIYKGWHPSRIQIYWNHNNPLFSSSSVRRALTHAINRKELLDILNFPEKTPITDGTFTNRQFFQGKIPTPLPYDPQKATQILNKEGWLDSDGDGLLEKEGENFRFTLLVRSSRDSVGEKSAILIQSHLRNIGVQMEIQTMDIRPALSNWNSGNFEATIVFTNTSNVLRRFLPERNAFMGYNNPRVTELIQKWQGTVDINEHDRIFAELSTLLKEDMPVTFLYPVVNTMVAHKRVKGLQNGPGGGRLGSNIELLWIEE